MLEAFAGKLSGIQGQPPESLLCHSAVYVVSSVLNTAIPFFLLPVSSFFITLAKNGLDATILVQKYVLKGVAMAFALSMAARFLLTWYLAYRLHRMSQIAALTAQR